MAGRILDLAREYSGWLRERITLVPRGESQVLSTPFLDPFNDGIQVHVDAIQDGFILHDDGETLDNLVCMGVKTEDSDRRKALIQRSLEGSGVRFHEGRLETTATSANLPQRAHFLICSILRLNDLWMSATPHRFSDFLEMVSEFLEEKQVLCNRNVTLPGKTVEHTIDFMIPLPKKRERLIKVIGTPSPQTAKIISFTWMDLRETRPDAERAVLLNDTRAPDPLEETSEEEFRRVSDETLSILRGYSTAIFLWSQRSGNEFERLWKSQSLNGNGAHG